MKNKTIELINGGILYDVNISESTSAAHGFFKVYDNGKELLINKSQVLSITDYKAPTLADLKPLYTY